jgi:hypothetical protein
MKKPAWSDYERGFGLPSWVVKIDGEYVLAEIRRLAHENDGRAPGQKRFASDTGVQEHEWRRYWARWTLALQEAGFQPNEWNQPLGEDAVLSRFVPEVRRLGRMPTVRERHLMHQEDPTFPSQSVFRRIGSGRDLTGKVADYCRNHPDCADVLAIVEPLLAAGGEPVSTDRDDGEAIDFGSSTW